MAQMMSSACLKLVARIDERDQDAILSRLDELQAQGVPAQKAQIQAAIDVLAKLQRQAGTESDEDEAAKDSSVKKSQARDVTETPEFKRWFGDSKVVDAKGKPLVVYHGTGADISAFDSSLAGKNFGESTLGIYFTNAARPDVANGFGYGSTASEYAQNAGGSPNVMPVYLSLQNPLTLGDASEWGGAVAALDKRRSDIARWVSEGGHDGVIYRDDSGDEQEVAYVALRPTQIKSAIGNNGQFDSTNPDIRKSRARNPSEIFGREIAPVAIKAYKSLSVRAKGIIDGWNINWHMGQDKLRSNEHWDEVVKTYEPVREKMRQVYGDTVPAYRGEKQEDEVSGDDRFLFSWTPMRDVATAFAVNRIRGLPAEITQAKVDEQVENYRKHGIARMSGYKFMRKDPGDFEPDGPDYYYIYQRDEMITDGDDIAEALQRDKEERDEWIAKLKSSGKLYTAEIPVDSIAFIPVNANLKQPEFVADYNPRKDAATEIKLSKQRNAMGFYSALAKGIDSMPTKAAPSGAWKAQIKGLVNKGAVKQDEVTWSGIEDWMDLQESKITKDQIAAYLEQGGVKVEETTLGVAEYFKDAEDAIGYLAERYSMTPEEVREEYGYKDERDYIGLARSVVDDRGDQSKYGKYTLPGGENYREVLLTLPPKPTGNESELSSLRAKALELEDRGDLSATENGELNQIRSRIKSIKDKAPEQYKSSHWDQPNVVAHIRVEDRVDADGAKTLFVEELQSDAAQDRRAGKPVPTMPFTDKTDAWLNLALKRIVAMAVDGGYDKVAFVNGEQSADRYDLSKQVSDIMYRKYGDDSYYIAVGGPRGGVHTGTHSASELEDYIGKELAQRIVGRATGNLQELSGLDLKVGGEGMKTFYDSIVPNAIKKLIGKMDGKLEDVRFADESFRTDKSEADDQLLADLGIEVQGTRPPAQLGFAITPKMHEQVSGQGMPLFSRQRSMSDEFDTDTTYYHGTTAAKDFKGFKVGKGGVNELGDGVYLTSRPEYAEAWAGRPDMGGRIIPAHIRNGDIFDLSKPVDYMALAKRIKHENPATDAELQAKEIRKKSVTEWTPEESRIVNDASADLWRTWLLESDKDLADQIKRGNLNTWLDRAGYIGAKNENSQIPGQVVIFNPKNIRSPWAKFNPKKADSTDILASRQRNPQEDTQEFNDWSEGAPVVHLGERHDFKSGQPVVVEALHGTTNSDLTEFKRERANIESDWGAGFYASNTPDDVATNYANNDGADLTARIERQTERIADEIDSNDDVAIKLISEYLKHAGIDAVVDEDSLEDMRDEYTGIAADYASRRTLSQESPNTLKLYIRMSNPAVQGGKGETFFDYTEEHDEEADSYAEPTGKLVEFVESLRNVAPDFIEADANGAMGSVWEKVNDEGGIGLSDLFATLKSSEGLAYATDDDGNSASTEVIRRALEDMGFDGVIDTTVSTKFKYMKGMNKDTIHFIAFDPTQLKSATGNQGTFDPKNPDIRKSTGRTSTGADWDSPSASKFDDMVYKLQDKQVDLKRVTEAIKTASGALADDLNVYLQEELYHGRAAKRTEDFVNMELTPLVEQMKADGLEISDVEEFLHARHAPEANKVIAQRNPGVQDLQDGGSGMKTSDALNYMHSLDPAMKAKLEAAADKVDVIIKKTREMYVDYELESKSTVDAWDKMFDHYIPLQREDKEAGPGLGQGFSIKGKETKGRTGSTRKVVDILANVAIQREKAIVRGEKNRVSQALVGLAKANPNEGFWTVDEVPTERVFNPKTGLVEDRVDPLYKSRNNAVIAKIADANGQVKEHAVLFNEEDPRALRMAESLKNLDANQIEGLLGVSAKISRYFASINTQWNPVFGVVNLARDVQGALLNLSSTPLKGDEGKIAKYTLSALKGVYFDARAARKGSQPNSAWAQLWEEFQEVGGQTGYRDLFATSADRADAIQKALDPDAWMKSPLGKVFTANGLLKVPMSEAMKRAGWLFDWISDYNLAMENGVRLAAYKAGLERGMSKENAASAAKNLTVNFNRKGQVSQQAGAMYAFFNASVQGTARIIQTVFEMEPGQPKTIRLSPFGKKVVMGGIALGSIQAMALAAAGFNDDDPPEFARERGLIIPIGDKKYLTIPMPLGFHVLPSIGRISTEFALSGFKDPHKRALSLASLFADTFNPIGNAGLSMQTLAPTALDPFVALTENKDYTGKPIARESSNKAIPGHALGKDTATTLAKLTSEGINALSGGNKYTSGVFSPTPDQIDYLIGQLTGGVGRELSKVEQSVLSTARGEDLPTYKIPLVGRFVGDSKSQASEGGSFYANTERLNRLETEIKGLQKDGKTAEAAELRRNSSEAYLISMANQAERQIQKLRAEKHELVKKDATREQVKAVEERITASMARLNRAVESLKEKQPN